MKAVAKSEVRPTAYSENDSNISQTLLTDFKIVSKFSETHPEPETSKVREHKTQIFSGTF